MKLAVSCSTLGSIDFLSGTNHFLSLLQFTSQKVASAMLRIKDAHFLKNITLGFEEGKNGNDEDELSIILPVERELLDAESLVATITEKNIVPSQGDIPFNVGQNLSGQSQTACLDKTHEHLSFLNISKEVTSSSQVNDVKPSEDLSASEVQDIMWDDNGNFSEHCSEKGNEVPLLTLSVPTSQVVVSKLPLDFTCVSCLTCMFHV